MKKYKKIYFIAFILVTVLSYTYHKSGHFSQSKERILVVSSQITPKTISFSGVVEPLKSIVIASSTDGTINEMSFHYGDIIKKGQLLFSITSEKFKASYKTALLQYIKNKTDFINAENQLRESRFLYKNKLISEEDFKSKESSFFNAKLALIQAKEELSSLLKILDKEDSSIYDLSIEKIDKITQALHTQNELQQLRITAPCSGVILLPSKNGVNYSEVKKLFTGDQVKQGDVLGVIGDLTGLKIHIEVDEFNVTQLKLGQKVLISEAAFPDLGLEGEISGIDSQGQLNRNGIPVFPVEISVPKLKAQERKEIHIGMSATVDINISNSPQITVPLKAVTEKNGLAYINVKDKTSGKIRSVSVKTGATTLDSVVIESNLHDGDNIVIVD